MMSTTDPYTRVGNKHQYADTELVLIAETTGRDQWGRLKAEVKAATAQNKILNQKVIDLLNERECRQFAEDCAALDGHVNYKIPLQYLTARIAAFLDEPAIQYDEETQAPREDLLTRFQFQTATNLLEEQLSPLTEVVQGFIHEGLWMFAGKSKRGKSWFMLDMALSVAAGRAAFGHFPTRQAPVLYLAFEDSKRRVKSRMLTIEPSIGMRDALHFAYEFPRLGEGACELLEAAIDRYGYGLIIVDVLAHIRQTPARGKNGESYQEIYDELMALQQLMHRHHTALILLDHLRKQTAEDIFETIQGSVAKQGAADALMVLDRKADQDDTYIHVLSKETGSHVHAMRFDQTRFLYAGEGEEFVMKKQRQALLQVFREEHRFLSIGEVLHAMGEQDTSAAYQRARRNILALEEDGYLMRRELPNTVKWLATALKERADYDDTPF